MTPLNPVDNHDATGVAVMHSSPDKSCHRQRLSFVDRGARSAIPIWKTHRLPESGAYLLCDPTIVNPETLNFQLLPGSHRGEHPARRLAGKPIGSIKPRSLRVWSQLRRKEML